ncbi:MAG: sigma-70 family RNA polymerase sigma factor [Cytophagaceae bacterium]|nr:sigma-70 family RNA polymerase sigma factor [Cytophagaceae bacterium]MBK9511958.1 sigma-70 family RNA polymerase sigma factor [Cytophagaceae bacterium]MBK9934901.1 sigma-70 family RNA polymerase sigma factor [Cytophagaceae bacterium]MBL0301339.1 sigma-70 family RNA polymerase sigma factor [Cytophagaceae bacterium]MBL0324158.1 sigma-70 family RNA polymerase sigma factor [Cytophagaceae bacterium]
MKPTAESSKVREILEGCKQNDRKCQELLYKQYFGFAMSLCLRYSSSREEALEILNDSFLKVFNKINTYDFERPFGTWLKRIVVNTAIDTYRSQNKHYFHHEIDTARGMTVEEVSPNDRLAYDDLLKLVHKLPKNYLANFNLYVIDGYTHEEISKMLGVSVGTSKSNVSRAREMLRRMLESSDKLNFERQ